MSYPTVIMDMFGIPTDRMVTIDIREDSPAQIIGDFLQLEINTTYDVIITNPPFNQAEDIIKKSLSICKDGGYVIMLLRLNFLGSKQRKQFWENNPPKYIYVHHKRISFKEDGGTDSIEYAHFVWKKGEFPTHALLRII